MKNVIFIAAIVLLAVISFYPLVNDLPEPYLGPSRIEELLVRGGETFSEVVAELKQRGLLQDPESFQRMAISKGIDRRLKPGLYKMEWPMYLNRLLDMLGSGRGAIHVIVRIPEGSDDREIVDILIKNKLTVSEDDAWRAVTDWSLYKFPFSHPESGLLGFILPDTYYLAPGDNAFKLIQRGLDAMESFLRANTKETPTDVDLVTLITLASIVEGEARLSSERPRIAGVFYNRLEKKMPLQSCATVQFALGVHKLKLTLKDLEVDSPYNTYKNKGLPPGPICNPSRGSILAAMQPEDNDLLFFVAKGDGGHIFSKTYEEHLKAKASVNK